MKTQTILVLIVFIIIAGILILNPFSRDSGVTKTDDVTPSLVNDTSPSIQMNLGSGQLTAGKLTAATSICINESCLTQDHINKLIGKTTIKIGSAYEQNGSTTGYLAREKSHNDVKIGDDADSTSWPKHWRII